MRKFSLISALVAGAAMPAAAAPITEWGWQATSQITAINGGNNVTFNGDFTRVTWGDGVDSPGDPESALTFSVDADPANATLTIDENTAGRTTLLTDTTGIGGVQMGNQVQGHTIIHSNFPIPAGSGIDGGALATSVLLTPITPPGSDIGPLILGFSFDFFETANGDSPCPFEPADSTPPAAGTINDNGCSDIFVLSGLSLNGSDIDPTALDFSFLLDGFQYTIGLDLVAGAVGTGLVQLAGSVCDEVQNISGSPGCLGFATAEGLNNAVTTFVDISVTEVPAPAPLALLGAGLLGLGLLRRRAA